MHGNSRIAAALVLAGAAASAQAGAPLLSEDAGVLAPGTCEAEGLTASTRAPGASGREHGVGLSCGVGHTGGAWQWGVGMARARADKEVARGLALGAKFTLWSRDDAAAVVLAPTLSWSDSGGGWRHVAQDLNLVYSGPLADNWTLHLNLAHGRDREADQRSTGWSAALEHAGVELGGLTLAPMGDVAGDDRAAPWWNLGLRATLVADRAWLGLSYARQIDRQRARLATLSVKLAF